MSIIRVQKDEKYSIIANDCFNDERLSYRAVGLLCYLLSKPNHWEVRTTELTMSHREGRDAVLATLKELRECGYITARKTFGGMEYDVRERPVTAAENQCPGFQGTDDQGTGNPPLVITDGEQGLRRGSTEVLKHRDEGGISGGTPIPINRASSRREQQSAPQVQERARADRGDDFVAVLTAYPDHRKPYRYDKELVESWNEAIRLGELPDTRVIVRDIERRRQSHDWTHEEGRYVPGITKYIANRVWNHPMPAAPQRRAADLNAGGTGRLVI